MRSIDHSARGSRPGRSIQTPLENAAGKDFTQVALVKELTSRGGKGQQKQKRTTFSVPKQPVTIPSLGTPAAAAPEGK